MNQPDSILDSLPDELAGRVRHELRAWREHSGSARLWQHDASLWTGADEDHWLGWLDIVEQQRPRLDELRRLSETVRDADIGHVLLLGMGGSSLFPEVLSLVFGSQPVHPELHVLDSTHPDQVRAVAGRLDLERTALVVASKSGTTLEPNVFLAYFLDLLRQRVGDKAPRRVIAITDPGSALEQQAANQGFLRVLHGVPSIGGRFSALSDFGLAPAALLGLDLERLLDSAAEMHAACGPDTGAEQNPGVLLGCVLGAAARSGRDKLTLLSTPALRPFEAWLEQLVAESTGKQGTAIIPVAGEPAGAPRVYGEDRLFVRLKLEGDADPEGDKAAAALLQAGQPLVVLRLADRYQLGAEVFRWELATAVAGHVLGINPFDQPDVEASKQAARRLTEAWERDGELPRQQPLAEAEGLTLYAADDDAQALRQAAGDAAAAPELLRAHVARALEGDYLALLAWLPMQPETEAPLERLRALLRDRLRVACCVGFGPRFLHSTGQAYKGGPASGVFLQLVSDAAEELAIPGRGFGFDVVKAAQELGDFEVLGERRRRALRVHLGTEPAAGLERVLAWLEQA